MTKQELIDKIKKLAKDKYAKQIKYVSAILALIMTIVFFMSAYYETD